MLIVSPHPKNDKLVHDIALKRVEIDTDYLYTPCKGSEAPWLGSDDTSLSYNTIRRFYDYHLPGMRVALEGLIDEHVDDGRVHIDLGAELTTLYAAYYAIQHRAWRGRRFTVSVAVHGVDRLGGSSQWLKGHPLLRRHLVLSVLNRADEVFVTSKETAVQLFQALPKVNRDIVGAPLTASESVPEAVVLPSTEG